VSYYSQSRYVAIAEWRITAVDRLAVYTISYLLNNWSERWVIARRL